jgi:hypothetical protein
MPLIWKLNIATMIVMSLLSLLPKRKPGLDCAKNWWMSRTLPKSESLDVVLHQPPH